MPGASKLAAAGLATAAAIATSGVATAGGDAGVRASVKSPRDAASGQATGVFSRGPVRGIVVVKRRAEPRSARVAVSLHGVPDGSSNTYLVGDTKPCSRFPDGGDIVFGIIMANTEGDFFRRTTARLRQRLARTRTLRIYDSRTPSASSQLACTRASLDKSSPKL